MAKYTFAQIERLWTDGGGNKALAPVMAAIALAESGGRTDALNNNPATGDYSVGLWQINYFNGLYAGRAAAYGTPQQLMADPVRQARAAVSVQHGQGLGAWTTYSSGAYRQYMSGAPPASNVPGEGQVSGGGGGNVINVGGIPIPVGGLASTASALGGIGSAFASVAQSFNTVVNAVEWLFVPNHWVRIFSGIGGALLAGAGLSQMLRGASGQGDVRLGMGILLFAVGGAGLFVAFHNLPPDVTDTQSLMGYFSKQLAGG